MQEHDSTTDKHGNDVSEFVTKAVEALRDRPETAKVHCDYSTTGMIQVFSSDKYISGDVLRTAREHGYEPAFTTTRSAEMQDYPVNYDRVGYAELRPEEHV